MTILTVILFCAAIDSNVDFTRNWSQTALLSSFCDNVSMSLAHRHTEYSVDFTYNFDMSRYSTLDHFILSGILFDKNCVQTVSVFMMLITCQIMNMYCLTYVWICSMLVLLSIHHDLHGKKVMQCK